MFKLKHLIICMSLFLVACSPATPLQNAMQDMAGDYKQMKKTKDVEKIKSLLVSFKLHLSKAKQQVVPDKVKKQFDEGLRKLEGKIDAFEAALNTPAFANNEEAIKQTLKELDELKTHYHELIIR